MVATASMCLVRGEGQRAVAKVVPLQLANSLREVAVVNQRVVDVPDVQLLHAEQRRPPVKPARGYGRTSAHLGASNHAGGNGSRRGSQNRVCVVPWMPRMRGSDGKLKLRDARPSIAALHKRADHREDAHRRDNNERVGGDPERVPAAVGFDFAAAAALQAAQ